MRFHHYGIEVENLEASIPFYKKLLGLELESTFSLMDEKIVFLASEDFRLELIETSEDNKTTHICFEVPHLRNVMNQFNHNLKLEGPYKLQNGWETVFYQGPNQEIIEFIQTKNGL